MIGTCRLLFRGRVARLGRLAVEPDRRGEGVAAAILREADRVAREAGAESISLHAQTYALAALPRAGYEERGPTFVEEGIEHVAMEKRALSPELRIDPLTGPAGDRRRRARLAARARSSTCRRARRSTPRATRSPPATRTARRPRSTRCATNGDWRCGWCRTSIPRCRRARRDAGRRTRSPAGAASPTCSPAGPPRGAHEVIVNAPDPVNSLAELEPEQVETAMSVWRERMRAHADAAYVHVIVNEGKEAGASLPHTHAQLYALPFVPAAVARERERFTAYSDRTQGRNLLEDLRPGGGAPARARRRDRRRGRGALPVRRARAVPPPDRAAPPGRALLRRRAARRPPAARGADAAARRRSARCRRSTCGCAPRRATPSASAGASR